MITHLFMDGGRILKSVKTSYAEHLGSERLAHRVRDLMKEQHKMMFIALRDGQFDHVLEGDAPRARVSAVTQENASPSPTVALALPSADAGRVHELPDAAAMAVSAPAATALPAHRPLSRREAPELFSGASSDVAAINVVSHDAVVTSSKERPSSGRYAASRPAALFTTSKGADAGGSMFGEDLINEQSLDDVIMSYLADDLEAASPKK